MLDNSHVVRFISKVLRLTTTEKLQMLVRNVKSILVFRNDTRFYGMYKTGILRRVRSIRRQEDLPTLGRCDRGTRTLTRLQRKYLQM